VLCNIVTAWYPR